MMAVVQLQEFPAHEKLLIYNPIMYKIKSV